MNLTKNGVTIQIGDEEIVAMALQRLAGEQYPTTLTGISIPKIGEEWKGGKYGGIGRGLNGAADHHLVVYQEAPSRMNHAAALEWAKAEGGEIWTRWDSALCFANLRELFRTDEYYWTATQHEAYSAYAWIQAFGDGPQLDHHKDTEYRARLVRRFPIQ